MSVSSYGTVFVLDLTTLLGTYRRKAAGAINRPNSGFHLVDILTSVATGAESFKGNSLFIKAFYPRHSAFAEVEKPILPFVSGAIGTLPYPLDGTNVVTQVIRRRESYRAIGVSIVAGGVIQYGNIVMLLQVLQQLGNAQLTFCRSLPRANLINHASSPALKL